MEEIKDLEEEIKTQENEPANEPQFIEQPMEEQVPLFEKTKPQAYSPMDKPKSSNTPVIVVFVLLLLLLVGLGGYVILTLPKQLETKKDSASPHFWEELFQSEDSDSQISDGESNPGEDWVPDSGASEGLEDEEPAEGDTDGSVGIDWDEDWKEQFTNHSREEFTGNYYEETVDCIDESVSYQMNREFFEYEDEDNDVCIRISYIQLEGDIPNLENINDELKKTALWYVTYFEENSDTVLDNIRNTESEFYVESFAYVTYNDEDQISIVLNEHFSYGYYAEPILIATNINLKTGTILDNTTILSLNKDFGEEFRTRSLKQNGVSQGTENFKDEEILSMLQDESSLILFYTPLGMELGYSYTEEYYSGWITITMQDYEKYLAGM